MAAVEESTVTQTVKRMVTRKRLAVEQYPHIYSRSKQRAAGTINEIENRRMRDLKAIVAQKSKELKHTNGNEFNERLRVLR